LIGFVWSVLLLVTVLVTDDSVVRIGLSGPLVLFLTGHGVLRAIRPIQTGPLEHAVYSVGVSMTAAVAGGFLLNMLGLLTPIGWALWFLLVNGVAMVIALRHPRQPFVLPKLPQMHVWQIAGLGAAIAITIGAYALADYEIESFHEFKYTEFWLVPKPLPGKLVLGINNREEQPEEFDIEVTAGKNLIGSWRSIEVKPGEPWLKEITTGLEEPRAEATLYRSKDHAIYRRVSTFIPGAKLHANTAANTILSTDNRR
jgi:uncharacterized membrane protein